MDMIETCCEDDTSSSTTVTVYPDTVSSATCEFSNAYNGLSMFATDADGNYLVADDLEIFVDFTVITQGSGYKTLEIYLDGLNKAESASCYVSTGEDGAAQRDCTWISDT